MSGSTVGAVVGAAVGFVITGFNPAGAKWGWMIGSAAGAILFPPKGQDGPRLNDLTVQVSTYGHSIPRIWGTVRIAGNVFWAEDLEPHTQKEGGKGGPSYTTTSYTCSFGVLWCQGEVVGVRRKWANKTLRYDASVGNTGPVSDGAGWYGGTYTAGSAQAGGFVFYPGSATQPVDPTIQAHKGNAPAYRHRAYSVFEDLSLEKYNNALPQVEAEIVANGSYALPAPLAIGSGAYGVMQPGTPYFWGTVPDTGTDQSTIYVNDVISKTVVKTIVIPMAAGNRLDYLPVGDEIWVARAAPANLGVEATAISASGWAANRTLEFSGSAVTWLGRVAFCSTTQEVYFASINGISKSIVAVSISGVVLASLAGNFWTSGILDLPGTGLMAFVGDELLSGSTQHLMLVDVSARAVINDFTASTFNAATPRLSRLAWDSVRSRMVWAHEEKLDHFYVATVSGLTTGAPVQTSFPVALGQGLKALIYHKGLDRFIGHGSTTTYVIHPETWAIEGSFNQGQAAKALYEVDGIGDYVLATNGNTLYRYYLAQRLTSSAVPVSTIVTDLSEDVGLTAVDLDVTDISGILCDGFVLANRGAAQAAIEQLLMAYQIDVVESGGKVKYVRRASRSAVIIDPEEMALHDVGQDAPTRLILTRADEVDLPRSVTIKYMNRDADYQIGAQTATRQTTLSRNDVTYELAVVMTDAHAKAVAEAVLYASWAGRTTAKWSMSLKYAELEPTDLVSIDGNYILISKLTRRGNMLECEGVFHSGVVFTTGSAAGTAEVVAQTIPLRSSTAIELMDIPLLRDQDNDAGFYVAASGYKGATWDGCVIFKSSDGGGSWDEVATLTTAATAGAAATALGDFSQNVFDEFNTVTVALRNGTLSSITESAVLNGGNAALLGSEIIQFRTAVLNADGSYTLSGLLRGRKGSPTSGHVIGDRFVLLNTTSVFRVDMSTAEIGLERLYKAVTIGDSLAGAKTIKFTNTAIGLECLSGVHLGGGRDASQNLTINWVRRTRIGGEWRDYVDASLGEASESYEVEIWNSAFTTLKRTITGLTSPTASYTSAQQVTDFGSNQSTVYVRVYQLSATVGRGFALQGSI